MRKEESTDSVICNCCCRFRLLDSQSHQDSVSCVRMRTTATGQVMLASTSLEKVVGITPFSALGHMLLAQPLSFPHSNPAIFLSMPCSLCPTDCLCSAGFTTQSSEACCFFELCPAGNVLAFTDLLVVWLVGWFAGWLASWFAGWFAGWLVARLLACLVGWRPPRTPPPCPEMHTILRFRNFYKNARSLPAEI